jgi:hypothetical protein
MVWKNRHHLVVSTGLQMGAPNHAIMQGVSPHMHRVTGWESTHHSVSLIAYSASYDVEGVILAAIRRLVNLRCQ